MPLPGSLTCSVVIAAAGESTRMGGVNKMLGDLNGSPVLARTLAAFQNCPAVDEIVVVTRRDDLDAVSDICTKYAVSKATKVIVGGSTRLESVHNGIYECSPRARLIAIHDGARPLVTDRVITDAVKLALKHHAAAPAVPVTSTVKQAKNHVVTNTPNRSELFEIQTPQVFDADLIKAAVTNAVRKSLDVTDDCMAVEAIGATVWLSEGSYENLKITTPPDLITAGAIMSARDGAT